MKIISEIIKFLKILIKDYKKNSNNISKKNKKLCYFRIIKNILSYIWSAITAPFIYPIWYLFRKKITQKIYRGTTWQEIDDLVRNNKVDLVKKMLKSNGRIYYWLWTYGDINDPLGRGGFPEFLWNGKNTFWNRYRFSALRNSRFNINYLNFRSGDVIDENVIIDNRDFNYYHVSKGIEDRPDGLYFKWMKDVNEKWYIIYESNNYNQIFYFGYVGFNEKCKSGRFELSYRKTNRSYKK